MFTKSKNGKHYTIYINRSILLFIALVSIIISGSAPLSISKTGWVIVIDPGHGGRDPGAIGSFSYEKNIVLPVALKMGEYLEKNIPDIKVIFTRKTDIHVELYERPEIANRNNADLFISVHANLIPKGNNAYGAETFIMGHSLDEQNLAVAMKENEVMLLDKDYSTKYEGFDPKSTESYIMFTTMQNAFSKQSTDLAARIQNQFKNRLNRFDRGVKQERFWVLWKTTMPSVLTELGFISNKNEEKYMNSKSGQDSLAMALFLAVRDYINEIDRKSMIPDGKTNDNQINSNNVSVQTVTNKTETVPIPAKPESTVIYMVQISASPKKVPLKPENFRSLKDISELFSGGRYRYTSGRFTDYDSAAAHRKKIGSLYPDAFVIAVKDNKIVPLQETLDNNRNKSK
jgi:N-acetylmuramoyl-L-alanine amidase